MNCLDGCKHTENLSDFIAGRAEDIICKRGILHHNIFTRCYLAEPEGTPEEIFNENQTSLFE